MTYLRREDWSFDHHYFALEAMADHSAHAAKDHPMNTPKSVQLTWDRIKSGVLGAAYVGTGYLLVYDVGPNWCTEEDILHECLLVRALRGGSMPEALADIRALARDLHCVGVSLGNGTGRPGISRLYERAGARKLNESFYMEA